jgi:hypothetical protein
VIARIATRGFPQFVALHRDERAPSRAIWVPVRGDRGRTGEISWPASSPHPAPTTPWTSTPNPTPRSSVT